MNTEKPSIYVLGASGFLGGLCAEYFISKGYTVFTEKVDITKLTALKEKFLLHTPDVIINCAGVRAPNIDWCESHKGETTDVNYTGALNVVLAAKTINAYPIHISSGCVYSGGVDTPFTEEDDPNFAGNFYSGIVADLQTILKTLPVLCARIRIPFSIRPHERNILNKLIKYGKVVSIPNSITCVEDLWQALEHLINLKDRYVGLLNLTNTGYVTYDSILEAYRQARNPDYRYETLPNNDLSGLTIAARSNCVLSTKKAQSLGVSMPELTIERMTSLLQPPNNKKI